MPPKPHAKRFLMTPTIASLNEPQPTGAQGIPMLDVRSTKRLKEDVENASNGEAACIMKDASDMALTSFSDDVVCQITGFLDAKSLLTMRQLNRSFRTLASTGESGWTNLCQVLWRGKVHVLPAAIAQSDPMEGYRLSVLDARDRDYLTTELTYNPETRQGTIWSFRFKESAGSDWTSWDPWYNGLPCRKMVFLGDGSVKYAHQEPPSSGDNSDYRTVLTEPPMTMNWRFLTRPLDLPARPMGSYIRFEVGGRDVPTYCVRRSPTKNWGFIMESCWGIFASFDLPKRPLHGTTGRVRQRGRRIRRAQDPAGTWFNVEVDDSEASSAASDEDNDDDDQEEENTDRLLTDDSQFSITSGLQWREAFLYNFGARILPEGGDEAVANFDAMYGNMTQQR